MKLTPWFPPYIKPVRQGWYDATMLDPKNPHEIPRFYWDGDCWYNPYRDERCMIQDRFWRGISR